MKLSEIKNRSGAQKTYDDMVADLKQKSAPNAIPTEGQAASTKAILERDPAKDEEHFNRPLPEQTTPVDVNNLPAHVGTRTLSLKEVKVYERMQRSDDRNSEGQADLPDPVNSKRKAAEDMMTTPSDTVTGKSKGNKVKRFLKKIGISDAD